MAKTIGSLNVSMGLSITDFITNLDKVKDDMGSLEAVTSEASKHFDEDVAGVMGDALHKFAKTSKLGADDALAFAVSLKKLGLDADTITSTLDKFAKGIGKFAKNAGEASKAFAGILGKIGESDKVLLKDIQALESMGVKAFDALAKELSKVEGKAVSTAEVMKRIASGSLSGADALKALTSGLTAVAAKITDTNTAEYIANSKTLKGTTDLATKSLELQARQMMIDSGATKQLFEDMKKLEEQELAIIDLENKAKGIVPPVKPNENTAHYFVNEQMNLKAKTDLATKSLELQARQMNVDSGATKQLYEDMKKLETQELALIALENKAKGIIEPVKVDTNTAAFVNEQMNLKSQTDLASKALEMQARQMNIDSGATKQLYDDMKKLELQELKLIEAENKARGIPPPLPIMPPPIPVNKNTAEYVLNAKKMASETDILNKSLDLQARQMMIDSGATKDLYEEMKKLEAQEKKLIDAENKAKGITTSGGDAAKESQAKSKLASFLNHVEGKIKSAASSIFKSVTNLIMNPVTAIGGALASYGVYKIYDRAVMAFANTEEILTRIKGLAGEASAVRLGGVMGEIANQGRIAQDVVGKLATGFLGLGVSGKDAATMIESFGRISLVAGSGATDVFNKLGEVAQNMMRTGVASKDDFAALAAMGLPVYDALAQRLTTVMGRAISAQDAMQMLARGSVGAQDAVNALAGMQNNADVIKQAEAQAGTLKGIYARLAGEVEGFFTEFGAVIVDALDLKGFSEGLIGFMQNLRSNFDSLIPAIKNIGMILSVVRDVLFQAFSGLVKFFTTMGGADMATGSIENIRGVVIGFSQGVIAAMQSVMLAAVDILNNIIETVGGLEKFGKIIAGFGIGFSAGAAGSLVTGGTLSVPMALVGGAVGATAAAFSPSGGTQIDPEAIKARMRDALKAVSDAIGNTGSTLASTFTSEFVTKLMASMKGQNWFGDALGNIGEAFRKLTDAFTAGTIGEGAFMSGLTSTTASAIAVFKRQMDLGTISAERFERMMGQLKGEAFRALDMQLSAGTITNEEYGNSIMAIQAQFDALNPPDLAGLNAFMGGDNMPAWIRELSNIESPLETYRRKMEELKMTLADRPDLFAAGAAQLTAELEKSVGAMEALKNPGALMQGSAAAFSQVLKIQNAGKGETAAEKLLRLQQQAFAQQQAQTALQQQIAAATMNQANMVIAAIN